MADSGNNAVRRIQLYPTASTPTSTSMKGFAVTVSVAEPDTDGDGMPYDFAALKVNRQLLSCHCSSLYLSTLPHPPLFITPFLLPPRPSADSNDYNLV